VVDSGAPVLIIDDHQLFSSSLCAALRAHGLDAQRLPVSSAAAILRGAARAPEGALVLLDLALGGGESSLDGAALAPELVRQGKRVLVLTGGDDQTAIASAVAAGALGVLDKAAPLCTLLSVIARADAGEPIMDDSTRRGWLARHRQFEDRRRERDRRLDRLSPGEREVLRLLAQGHRAADIVERRVVSMATVRTQIRSILAKLEVNSQIEAVALFRDESVPSEFAP
jgi:DNA-binding NarL/FixJ family response regulator